ncbi:hypothetical protein KAJ27_01375, partial [bacterium]|nr:hypothetical protein [bacterium]
MTRQANTHFKPHPLFFEGVFHIPSYLYDFPVQTLLLFTRAFEITHFPLPSLYKKIEDLATIDGLSELELRKKHRLMPATIKTLKILFTQFWGKDLKELILSFKLTGASLNINAIACSFYARYFFNTFSITNLNDILDLNLESSEFKIWASVLLELHSLAYNKESKQIQSILNFLDKPMMLLEEIDRFMEKIDQPQTKIAFVAYFQNKKTLHETAMALDKTKESIRMVLLTRTQNFKDRFILSEPLLKKMLFELILNKQTLPTIEDLGAESYKSPGLFPEIFYVNFIR